MSVMGIYRQLTVLRKSANANSEQYPRTWFRFSNPDTNILRVKPIQEKGAKYGVRDYHRSVLDRGTVQAINCKEDDYHEKVAYRQD